MREISIVDWLKPKTARTRGINLGDDDYNDNNSEIGVIDTNVVK